MAAYRTACGVYGRSRGRRLAGQRSSGLLLQRHIDLVVEGVVAAVISIGGNAGWGKDDGAAEDIADDPPGPGSCQGHGFWLIAVLGDDSLVVVLSTERDGSWC